MGKWKILEKWSARKQSLQQQKAAEPGTRFLLGSPGKAALTAEVALMESGQGQPQEVFQKRAAASGSQHYLPNPRGGDREGTEGDQEPHTLGGGVSLVVRW